MKMKRKPTYLIFLDLSKAYDSVNLCRLLEILVDLKCPPFLLSKIYDMILNKKIFIELKENIIKINPTNGLLQGSLISPMFFNLYINSIFLEIDLEKNEILKLYADDILIITNKAERIPKILNNCFIWEKNNNLSFNKDKSRILPIKQKVLRIYDEIEGIKVDEIYNYLGINIRNRGMITKKVNSNIILNELNKINFLIRNRNKIGSRLIPLILIQKILPKFTYGTEYLNVHINKLNFLHRSIKNFIKIFLSTPNNFIQDEFNFLNLKFHISIRRIMFLKNLFDNERVLFDNLFNKYNKTLLKIYLISFENLNLKLFNKLDISQYLQDRNKFELKKFLLYNYLEINSSNNFKLGIININQIDHLIKIPFTPNYIKYSRNLSRYGLIFKSNLFHQINLHKKANICCNICSTQYLDDPKNLINICKNDSFLRLKKFLSKLNINNYEELIEALNSQKEECINIILLILKKLYITKCLLSKKSIQREIEEVSTKRTHKNQIHH